MSLLKLIQQYDNDREEYITSLECEIKKLREQVHELNRLVSQGEAIRERFQLEAILAGAYTKKQGDKETLITKVE